VIEAAERAEEKHAVIGSLHHLVPLRQLDDGDGFHVSFERVVNARRHLRCSSVRYPYGRIARPVPSQTVPAAPSCEEMIPSFGWKETLSVNQKDRIMRIVKGFGLSAGTRPRRSACDRKGWRLDR
jgi:hypothetical protein